MTVRHLLGEELVNLGTNELEQLENQLDGALEQIRLTKNQFIANRLLELKRKVWNYSSISMHTSAAPCYDIYFTTRHPLCMLFQEEMLEETNNALRIKLEETDAVLRSSSWEVGEQSGVPPHQQQETMDSHCRNNPLQMRQ
ncbi:unnamed protein product [Linum tenue]|uniref:K-box domain-containing protein n=1 Tax=Linum tenue TaxID=586396 RepID=A0AAV0NY76_9ROSI|nr:unnamed protein product [Linum tenue]